MSTKAVGSLWSKFFLLRYSPRHYDKAGVFRSVTLRVVSNPPGPVRCAPLCITGAGGVYPFLLVAGSTVNSSPPIRHTLLRRNLPANSFLRATVVRVGPAPQTPDFFRRVFTPTCTHVCLLRNALKIFHFFVRTIIYRRRSYTTCTCHHVWSSTRTDGRVRGKGMRVEFMSGIGTSNDRAYQFVTSLLFASFNDGNSFHGPATALPNTPP